MKRFCSLKISFETSARICLQRPGIQIPHIVLDMAAKFQMWPKEVITPDQIFGESQVVSKFLPQSVWKDHIVSDSSIPPNTEFGDSTTHWWKRFQSTGLISPCPPKRVTTTTTSADRLPAKQLPLTGIQPLRHRHHTSGIKRPSPQDLQDDGDNKDKGTAKKTTGKDNAGKATGARETKCHKVSSGTPCEGGDIEMLFSLVSHKYICCDACSDGKRWCQQCVANDQPCIVRKTVNGKKFNACDACGTRRTKCNTLHNLSAIVDSDGQVIHAAGSWNKLTNLKVKDTEGKVKATMGKDKGKSQATDPEQDQEDDQWAFEPNPEPTPASQPKPVSTIYQDLKLLTTLISRMQSLVHPGPKEEHL